MKRYYYASFTYLILGLIAGIFYRELTRAVGFTGDTVLRSVHTHLLVLGCLFFLVVLLLEKSFDLIRFKGTKVWFVIYQVALLAAVATMIVRGVAEVRGFTIAGLNRMAGVSHALLGISLVWFMTLLGKAISIQK